MRGLFSLVIAVLAWNAAAVAGDATFRACANAYGRYDPALSRDWQQRLQNSDASAMREISGKWYAEFYNAQVGMAYNNVFSYLPTGVLEFTTRTCSQASGMRNCSDDYGHGLFTAQRDPNGWIFITRNISSLTRTNACGGFYARMDRGGFVTQDGTRWKRVK